MGIMEKKMENIWIIGIIEEAEAEKKHAEEREQLQQELNKADTFVGKLGLFVSAATGTSMAMS